MVERGETAFLYFQVLSSIQFKDLQPWDIFLGFVVCQTCLRGGPHLRVASFVFLRRRFNNLVIETRAKLHFLAPFYQTNVHMGSDQCLSVHTWFSGQTVPTLTTVHWLLVYRTSATHYRPSCGRKADGGTDRTDKQTNGRAVEENLVPPTASSSSSKQDKNQMWPINAIAMCEDVRFKQSLQLGANLDIALHSHNSKTLWSKSL